MGLFTKLSGYVRYYRDKRRWVSFGGVITRRHIRIKDFSAKAGEDRGHYFHQDLLVARLVHDHKPKRHIDIGSRVDGFVAHVASFRQIEVFDIRPLGESVHKNIVFRQADLMNSDLDEKTDSLSCLHAIEHFGLGRYSDPIDVNGHTRGISNLVRLIEQGGRLYISFPIGIADQVHFNAHRVFHPESILDHPDIREQMTLVRFDFVDDDGDLHMNSPIASAVGKVRLGCGIYTFEKSK